MQHFKNLLLTLSLSILLPLALQAADNPYLDALPGWQNTLTNYVDDQGSTDFIALSKNSGELKSFVEVIEKISPATNPELFPNQQDVLAYHINAYNALAMWGVIERGIPKNFSSLLKRASFFKFRSVTIGGGETSLYDYENKVIRPLDEERLHYALNCMVRDCPRLPQTVFTAENLDSMLAAATLEFFKKEKHIQIDHDKKQLRLSSILKFYTSDFVASGNKQDLLAYVNQYLKQPVPSDYEVKFLKYDWTVNQQGA